MTPIHSAIVNGDVEKVKELLEWEPGLIDEMDENGVLMALLAAKTGNLPLLRYIVEYSRASMNIYDSNHQSILHYGTMSGNLQVCRYLVEKVGMSPVEGNLNLVTPYELADLLAAQERAGLVSKNAGRTNGQADYQGILQYYESIVGAPLSAMYKNPIRTGFFPDPSIVRVDNDYYMVNSTFIYFPCIPVSHSTDLIHWEIIGYAITNPEWAMLNELEGGRGFWAPDISYYKGRFYITATYRLNDDGCVYRKQIVVSSDKPEGPYSKPAIIDEDGIDPSIFNDDDGRRYMLLNRGARIFELNEDATKQISEAEMLYYGDHKRAPEGPHLLKKDGYYYLFEAEGGTGPGHRITVSRSRTLKGRYEPCPYNPIMRQQDEAAMIQRCGHGKPVQTQNGQWYMVYLCGRKIVGKNGEQCSMLGRETALDPITWTADGWPIVNQLNGPSCLQIKPDLPVSVTGQLHNISGQFTAGDDDAYVGFDEKTLYQNWMFVRAPEADGYRIAEGKLILKGSRKDLNSMYARNILLRRQTDFSFEAKCKMQLPDLKTGQDAGVTCYYDENTYLKFGVFCDTNGLYVKVQEKIGEQVITHPAKRIDDAAKTIIFQIAADGFKRCFMYSLDGESFEHAAYLDNVYYLCDEGLKKGKRFTGAMLGMYAHAGEDAEKPLYVTYENFTYERVIAIYTYKINEKEG